MNKEELLKEEKYLSNTIEILEDKIILANLLLDKFDENIAEENKKYLEQMRNMNLSDLSIENTITLQNDQRNLENMQSEYFAFKKDKEIFTSMKDNPYFAKIDFNAEDSQELEKYYIGLNSLTNTNSNDFVVIDWRSKIASLFYDYELGKAKLETNNGYLNCDLKNKRQFKIENGKLKYYFDTNLNIQDDILMDTLANTTNNKMKNIVQTIQKEQNAIIRTNENNSIIVQGVAGSGKTAIAMHRVAYLLYRLRNKIKSSNIKLISPNNAFSSYISSILPELHEEDIEKIQLDKICQRELRKTCIVEPRIEQVERITNNPKEFNEYTQKISEEFCNKLTEFITTNVLESFNCNSFDLFFENIDGKQINHWFLERYKDKNIFDRVTLICDAVIDTYFFKVKNQKRIFNLKRDIFCKLYESLKYKNIVKIYKDFLESNGLELSLVGNKVRNEDSYCLLKIREFIFGLSKYNNVEHLIVDELQDYSAVQLDIINKLFKCTKTLLGDYNQCLTNNNFYNFEFIKNNFKILDINTSYRPTMQIGNLSNFIGSIKNCIVVQRNGEDPKHIISKNYDESIDKLIEEIKNFENKNLKSIAVITKTNCQAIELYDKIKDRIDIKLIDDSSDEYNNDTCIISSFNSKGLEFDGVIVFDTSENNYNTELDNKLLYIATTRALHQITLISINNPNKKVDEYFKNIGGNL